MGPPAFLFRYDPVRHPGRMLLLQKVRPSRDVGEEHRIAGFLERLSHQAGAAGRLPNVSRLGQMRHERPASPKPGYVLVAWRPRALAVLRLMTSSNFVG